MIQYPAESDIALAEYPSITLRGIGQVFFQENAATGALFALGIALSSPIMAIGAIVGSLIGAATAQSMRFDAREITGGIYGFNSALVGIATFFFFEPGVMSWLMLIVGCVAAAFVTRAMRQKLTFPTYTTPFIVVTWVLFLLGRALGVPMVSPGPPIEGGALTAVAHGVSQVMFQASIWTALLFVVGIAISDWRHAAWVVVASAVGVLVANYHISGSARAIDVERLVERAQGEVIALGLYGYNATLAAVALWLWKRSLAPPLLGALLTVPIAELVPLVGLPALTAPFVLATWIVLAIGWWEDNFIAEPY